VILRLPAIFLYSDGLLHSDSQVTANPFLQISILESALEQTEENLRKYTGASIGAGQQTEENLIESTEASIGARQQTEENLIESAEASIDAEQQTEENLIESKFS
jgi:hypothetical protein